MVLGGIHVAYVNLTEHFVQLLEFIKEVMNIKKHLLNRGADVIIDLALKGHSKRLNIPKTRIAIKTKTGLIFVRYRELQYDILTIKF